MTKSREIWIASLLLCLMFGLQVTSVRHKSPTYDEPGHITRGYAYVALGDTHIRVGTPILLNALNALPLLALPEVRLPVEHPSWQGTNFHPISQRFMWDVNDNADQITFLARVPTMLLALLLAVFCYRWARELFGPWGGLLSLLLCVLDPNLIAHGRLATTDLGVTALSFIAVYWLWRLLRRPGWGHLLAAGAFLGLAQASKFSALLLGPIYALLFAIRLLAHQSFVFPRALHRFLLGDRVTQPWWGRLGGLAITALLLIVIAAFTLWGVYGFELRPIDGVTAWPVPAATHLEQLLDIYGRLQGQEERAATAFLMGELYTGGRWQYFPVVFALKTPLPTLVLLLGAVLLSVRKGIGALAWVLWLPPLLFFAVSLTSELNLGYRYILPVLPFLLVLAGRAGPWLSAELRARRAAGRALLVAAASLLVGWSAWSGLSIYPHYLTYYNELAGGPENGWRYVVDSNIDWGQDLKGLKGWMDEHGVARVALGYVGEAHPSYYGIDFEPLPSSPDRWEHPLYHDLYGADPAPGWYAISANLIQGRNLADPETYAWFRAREPVDKVGYSIFIYHVPLHGEGPVVAGLAGLVPADIRPADYARLGTNDVRVLWFDIERALVFPGAGDNMAAFVAGGAEPHPALAPLWSSSASVSLQTRDGRPMAFHAGLDATQYDAHVAAIASASQVWHLPAAEFAPGDPQNHGQLLTLPVGFGAPLALLAYELEDATLRPGEVMTLVTYWEVRTSPSELLRLFVHLLDANSVYSGGEDRLDLWYDNWRPGDRFAQVQQVPLDAGASPGAYQVEIGWYDPETMVRLPVLRDGTWIGDRVLLRPVEVE
ncbi:MAG: glycosyltransferase family 39 protein [Anaerolineae bacterium]|nr:glycosyltransferase family 39 protein [Anaerolineae bacterium]